MIPPSHAPDTMGIPVRLGCWNRFQRRWVTGLSADPEYPLYLNFLATVSRSRVPTVSQGILLAQEEDLLLVQEENLLLVRPCRQEVEIQWVLGIS